MLLLSLSLRVKSGMSNGKPGEGSNCAPLPDDLVSPESHSNNSITQQRVMITQQNMASIQHQQALQQMQQAAAAQQQSLESLQTSQAQSVNQTQALLVNTANLHQQLQQSGGSGSGNTGGMQSQQGNQGGGSTNTMCLQPQTIQSTMASSPNLHQQQIGSISLQGANVGGSQTGSTTITTMSTLPQQQQNAQPQQLQQVQVIQQPMQNAYVQQVYNAQGQMLMSALHPNMNPGSIQVIAAGKPFQSNQLTSHVLSKPVLTANTQQGTFPSYATIPTTTNQTLVITGGQLGVISGQLPQSQGKPQDLQKSGGAGGNGQVKNSGAGGQGNQHVIAQNCVASHPTMIHQLISPIQYTTCGNGRQGSLTNQAQTQVQIASPWQLPPLPQVWTSQSHHPQVIQNPIFIRGPQQDQPMFIQQSQPQSQSLQQPQAQQTMSVNKQEMKTVTSPQVSRTLSILPSTSMVPAIRPATSASTQIVKSQQIKMKTKAILTKSNLPPQKDAQNQTKPGMQQVSSPHIPHQILPATKMIITSQGTIVQAPIDSKVVGQVTNQQTQAVAMQHTVAMPQGTVAMQQGTVAMQQSAVAMQQGVGVVHQPQLIQPKPPPLMSLSMPSLEPLPPQDKATDQGQAMDNASAAIRASTPLQGNQEARLTDENAQSHDVASGGQTVAHENGQAVNESKGEPMEISLSDTLCSSDTTCTTVSPMTNGLSTGASGVQMSSAMSHQVTPHTQSLASSTPLRSSSPAVTQAVQGSITSAPLNQTAQGEETKEKRPPKAMVKPHSQVLTHIIEGFVIQESSEPFPINRTNLLNDLGLTAKSENQSSDSSGEPPVKKQSLDGSVKTDEPEAGSGKLKCESCGKIDLKEKFKKKRFCSSQCARRGSNAGRKRSVSKDEDTKPEKDWLEGEKEGIRVGSEVETNSDASSEPTVNPLKWTVAQVCDFIKNLPGCTDYVEDFAIQEIDGQALMLLKADHLMSAMSMKLGPALKICAKIDTMRTDNPTAAQTSPVP